MRCSFDRSLSLVKTAVLPLALAAMSLSAALAGERERALVFRNVDVFDGSRMIHRTTVVVRAGMIRELGPDVAVPPSAQIIDGKGKTLLPGLIDAHTHVGIVKVEPFLRDALSFGVTPSMRGSLERKFPPNFGAKPELANAEAAVGALHRAGVPILVGTDVPAPGLAHGLSLHRELELLVHSGLSPLEALAAATSVPARAFGLRDRGRVAKGLRADLVLVDGAQAGFQAPLRFDRRQ